MQEYRAWLKRMNPRQWLMCMQSLHDVKINMFVLKRNSLGKKGHRNGGKRRDDMTQSRYKPKIRRINILEKKIIYGEQWYVESLCTHFQ